MKFRFNIKCHLVLLAFLLLPFIGNCQVGLKAYYPFTGNAVDSTGNGYNGVVNGATLTTDRFGRPNHAYAFNPGPNGTQRQNINVPNFRLTHGTDFTVTYWIYLNKVVQNSLFLYFGFSGTNGIGMQFASNPICNAAGSLDVLYGGVACGVFPRAYYLPARKWCRLTLRRKSGTVSCFRDDSLLYQGADRSKAINADSINFGAQHSGYFNTLDGKLDDIGIYNRALADSEIVTLSAAVNLDSIQAPVCAGNSINISYKPSVTFATNNQFSAFLYDTTGTFPDTIAIGSHAGTGPGQLQITIPPTLPSGKYKVFIKATAPYYSNPYNAKIISIVNVQKGFPIRNLDKEMLAHYPLNNNYRDATQHGHDLTTFQNSQFTTDRKGIPVRASAFQGNNAILKGRAILGINQDFTLCAWIYSTSNQQWTGVIYNGNSGADGFGFSAGDAGPADQPGNSLKAFLGGVSSNITQAALVIPLKKWCFIAMTRKGNLFSSYLDTTLTGTGTGTPNTPTNEFTIGATTNALQGGKKSWQGSIDDVRIYSKALTADEIKYIFKNRFKNPVSYYQNLQCGNTTAKFKIYEPQPGVTYSLTDANTGQSVSGTGITANSDSLLINFGPLTTQTTVKLNGKDATSLCNSVTDTTFKINSIAKPASPIALVSKVNFCDSLVVNQIMLDSAFGAVPAGATGRYFYTVIPQANVRGLTLQQLNTRGAYRATDTLYVKNYQLVVTPPDTLVCISDNFAKVALVTRPINGRILATYDTSQHCTYDFTTLEGPSAPPGDTLYYSWSNGTTSQNLGISQPGTVTLNIRNRAGCTFNLAPFTVPGNIFAVRPTISVVNGSSTFCAGNSVQLQITNPKPWQTWQNEWVYNGTNIGSGNSIQASQAGKYYFTATDQYGCKGYDSIILTVNQTVIVHPGHDTTVCKGQSFSIGHPDSTIKYAYSWSSRPAIPNLILPNLPFQTLQIPTNQLPAPDITFFVAKTDSTTGCRGIDSVKVHFNSPPIVSAINQSGTLCAGNFGRLSISGISLPNLKYRWRALDSTQAFTLDTNVNQQVFFPPHWQTGQFRFQITATNRLTGCFAVDTLIIILFSKPPVNVVPTVTACAGDSVKIGAPALPGLSYFWTSQPTGITFNNNTAQPTVIAPSNPGLASVKFKLTVTENVTRCQDTATVTLLVNARPTINTDTLVTLCSGDAKTLAANTGTLQTTPRWHLIPPLPADSLQINLSDSLVFNPIITAVNNGFQAHSFKLKLKAATTSGCGTEKEISVLVYPKPRLFNTNRSFKICSSDTVQLGNIGPLAFGYVWSGASPGINVNNIISPNIQNAKFTALNPSLTDSIVLKLLVTATEPLTGCKVLDTVFVQVNPSINPYAGPDVKGCSGDVIELGNAPIAGYSYFWKRLASNDTLVSGGFVVHEIASKVKIVYNSPYSRVVRIGFIRLSTFIGCTKADTVYADIQPKPRPIVEGPNHICPGMGNIRYYVPNNLRWPGNKYQWTFISNAGGIVTTPKDSAGINVSWGGPENNAIVSVTVTSAPSLGGCSASFIDTISVNTRLQPEVLARGPINFCIADSAKPDSVGYKAHLYTPKHYARGSYYFWDWNRKNGKLVDSTHNSSNPFISIVWNKVGTDTVIVSEGSHSNRNGYNDTCYGTSAPLLIHVWKSPADTGLIHGPIQTCLDSGLVNFKTYGLDSSTFIWDAGSNQVVSRSKGLAQIRFLSLGIQTIRSKERSLHGCEGKWISHQINVNPQPFTFLSGDTIICPENLNKAYTTSGNLTGSRFHWRVTGGQPLGLDTNKSSINVHWDANAPLRKLVVQEESNAGCIGNPVTISPKLDASGVWLSLVSTDENNDKSLTINWKTGFTSPFKSDSVFLEESKDGINWKSLANLPSATNQLILPDSNRTQKRNYYRLKIRNHCSNLVTGNVLQNLVISAIPNQEIENVKLTWNLPENAGMVYEIMHGTNYGNGPKETAGNSNDTSFIFSEVASSFTHTFRLRGHFMGSDSVNFYSNIARVKLLLPVSITNNVVTPNGDNKNEQFEIKHLDLRPGSEVKIFNRWGLEVYTNSAYDNSWKADGLPEGIYFYQLKLSDGTVKTGSLSVIK